MRYLLSILLFISLGMTSCVSQHSSSQEEILPAASRTRLYMPRLQGEQVAVVANHTALVDGVHLVDTLLSRGIQVTKIFSPEHGFRGEGEAGELIGDDTDSTTGLPVISLYGSNKKPKLKDLEDVDVVVFDIQDVGVRFYTYISTMHYVMEACAETATRFLVLDRPNPNGFYVDGPVLDFDYRSFVGMHPIPLVHGMTIAEMGRMINGEGWLKDGLRCDYQWIACKNYTHDSLYQLPVTPSPNLPNMRSIYLYPSLGLMEGTVVNVGRGTDWPFQVYGHPDMKDAQLTFQPRSIEGVSTNPKYKGQTCQGIDLRQYPLDSLLEHPRLRLHWVRHAMNHVTGDDFFLPFFNNLAGNAELMRQLKNGVPTPEIRKSWEEGLEDFMKMRDQYLIYEDFSRGEL
ncbi:MAG TPA: DUF1343 domain-containing protein [Bacteroidales bacterium]|nr:DUF1343 domain-containing protein [Bacteroidales bacterium]